MTHNKATYSENAASPVVSIEYTQLHHKYSVQLNIFRHIEHTNVMYLCWHFPNSVSLWGNEA